jgi:hypothetical protein
MEITESFLEALKERVRSPFIGTFIFSWLAYNWKPVAYFIASANDPAVRIAHIETNYPTTWDVWWIPVGVALALTIGTPYLLNLLDKSVFWAKKERKIKTIGLHTEEVMAKKELVKETISLANIEARLKDDSSLLKKIASLEKTIQNKKTQLQTKTIDYTNLENEFSGYKESMSKNLIFPIGNINLQHYLEDFKIFKSSSGYQYFEEFKTNYFYPSNPTSKISTSQKLDSVLYMNGLISKDNSLDSSIGYQITTKGMYYIYIDGLPKANVKKL